MFPIKGDYGDLKLNSWIAKKKNITEYIIETTGNEYVWCGRFKIATNYLTLLSLRNEDIFSFCSNLGWPVTTTTNEVAWK